MQTHKHPHPPILMVLKGRQTCLVAEVHQKHLIPVFLHQAACTIPSIIHRQEALLLVHPYLVSPPSYLLHPLFLFRFSAFWYQVASSIHITHHVEPMLLVCLYLVGTSRGVSKLLWFALAVCTLALISCSCCIRSIM